MTAMRVGIGTGAFSIDELEHADSAALAAALVLRSGEMRWVESPWREVHLARNERRPYPPDIYRSFLSEAAAALAADPAAGDRDGGRAGGQRPACPDATLRRLCDALTGATLDDSYIAKLRDDLGLDEGDEGASAPSLAASGLRVAVIGAGMSGLHAATVLGQAGAEVFVLEKNAEVGGVWLENRYPDCGVDSHPFLYGWQQDMGGHWSRYDAKRAEILDYVRSHAEPLRQRIRFGTEVVQAAWNEARLQWDLSLRSARGDEALSVDVIVCAVGALNRPKRPEIPGLDTFAGEIFHTANWPGDAVVKGRRVGLIGNGSSGTQVGSWIARNAAHMIAFQRSPHWIKPRSPDDCGPVGAGHSRLLDELPYYAGWYRFLLYYWQGDREFDALARDEAWRGPGPNRRNAELREQLIAYIRSEVGGRQDLVDKLTPDYPPYTKRMVIDSGWYRALASDNVSVVTEPIVRADDSALITADGRRHALDVLVLATGFHGTRYFWPMRLRGRSGRYLDERCDRDDVRAYLGLALADFPNLFCLQGPNSSIGHGGSATFISECQMHYVLRCLERMVGGGHRTVEVAADAVDRYNVQLEAAMQRMVWTTAGVRSRYRNEAGRIVMNHPWSLQQFWSLTRTIDDAALRFR
ncbi:MAG: flavin-containing monooxygenase [Lautropia sp.]